MKTARWLAIVLPLLCVLVVPAWAEAEGWGLPSWNPFGGEEKTSSKASESSWRTGKKTDSSFASSSRSSHEPSMWSKMGSGTSSAWKKTTSTLTPWKKEKKTPARVTGSRNSRAAAASSKKQGSSWYNPNSWFSSKDTPPAQSERKAGSVSEFLNQPRVPY